MHRTHNAGHDTFTDVVNLEVGQEAIASLFLSLFKESTARQNDIVAILIKFDNLCLQNFADIRHQVTDTTQLNK